MKGVTKKMDKIYERINRTCIDCNKPFSISPAEQKYFESKGMELPKRCSECRKKRGKRQEFVCVDCNKPFFLYETNVEFFKKNGLELPKRCKNCIEDKKAFKAQQEAEKASGIVLDPVEEPKEENAVKSKKSKKKEAEDDGFFE